MDIEQVEEIIQHPFREHIHGFTPEEYVNEIHNLVEVLFSEDLIEMVPDGFLSISIGRDALMEMYNNFPLHGELQDAIEHIDNNGPDKQLLQMEISPSYDPIKDDLAFQYYLWLGNIERNEIYDRFEIIGSNFMDPRDTAMFIKRVLRLGYPIIDSDGEHINLRYWSNVKSARNRR